MLVEQKKFFSKLGRDLTTGWNILLTSCFSRPFFFVPVQQTVCEWNFIYPARIYVYPHLDRLDGHVTLKGLPSGIAVPAINLHTLLLGLRVSDFMRLIKRKKFYRSVGFLKCDAVDFHHHSSFAVILVQLRLIDHREHLKELFFQLSTSFFLHNHRRRIPENTTASCSSKIRL